MSGKEALWDDDDEEEEVIDVERTDEEDNTVGGDNLPQQSSDMGIVKPVENIDEVVEVYEQFDQIKKRLLKGPDVTKIGNNNHINKSGWRKIATAFNLTIETVNVDKTVEDDVVTYRVKAEASAPNGKKVSGTGMCASNESNHMENLGDVEPDSSDDKNVFKVDGKWRRLRHPREVNHHNIMATAETRAKNRAISDLVGGGEVSAEEMKSMILE